MEDPAQQAISQFESWFRSRPQHLSIAPGRLNLIGEHVDYNDGFVLPMAIDRATGVAFSPATESRRVARVASTLSGEEVQIPLDDSLSHWSVTAPSWARYVAGVIHGFLNRGATLHPFQALIHSDIPAGGGLSSSAALEVAMASALEVIAQVRLEPWDKARLCQRAEHDFAGVPCGIMDPLTSILGQRGRALLIDCHASAAGTAVELVPFPDSEVGILVVDSGVRHDLAAGDYAQRRAECRSILKALGKSSFRNVTLAGIERTASPLDALHRRRARHVITESARAPALARALAESNWSECSQLMRESHRSMRNDFEITCPEIDALVEMAESIGLKGGLIGSRMTGGGFGGCTVNLVTREALSRVEATLVDQCQSQLGTTPRIHRVAPADGARVIALS